jgi:hypothetical protein
MLRRFYSHKLSVRDFLEDIIRSFVEARLSQHLLWAL